MQDLTPMTRGAAQALIQDFYDALARGDVPAVLAQLAADVQWTEAERFPYYSGTWIGPQAVLEKLLKPLAADWADFSARPSEFIVDGERVVALGAYAGTYRRSGRSMNSPFAHVWSVRSGKLASFSMYTDTAKVLEATRD